MKIKEIRDLSVDELIQKDKALLEENFNLRMRHTSGQLESPAAISQVRKDIARVKTVLTERMVR
jgi:large subunit ribosomal protein L29